MKGLRIVFGEILIIVFIATALSCLVRGIYETFILDVSFSIIGKGNKAIKVILFSDLHASYFNVSLNKIIKVIEKSNADAILFAGDFTNGGSANEKQKAAKIISRIADTAAIKKIPFYAVSGNHDIFGTSEMLDGIDIRVLSNESVIVVAKDGSLWKILGLEDLKRGHPDYSKAKKHVISYENCKKENTKNIGEVKPDEIEVESISTGKIIGFSSKQDTNVLTKHVQFVADRKLIDCSRTDDQQCFPEIILAHNPDTIFLLPSYDSMISDLKSLTLDSNISCHSSYHPNVASASRFLLSGHLHGGQIWMPFDLEYKLLREEKMARLGYRKGPFEYLGLSGYISRGLGCVIVPLRFFSYPEISVLELRVE